MSAGPVSDKIRTVAPEDVGYTLKKIVVAHDASLAAQRALDDAMDLAKRFGAQIVVVHVQPPFEGTLDSIGDLRREEKLEESELDTVRSRLAASGVHSRAILRGGNVGDTLYNVCCEEHADLVMLGASGYRAQDRQSLGSTAEHLLRAVPCPAITYGPNVTSAASFASHKGAILIPVSLPCGHAQLRRGLAIARFFGRGLHILHVADPARPHEVHSLEYECEELSSRLREEGVQVHWSMIFGEPEAMILAKSRELDSPFILMPLVWSKRLSSISIDRVAAHVIHRVHVPVMTYRTE